MKKNKLSITLIAALAISVTGCVSSTKPKTTKLPTNQPQVSETLKQEEYLGLKRVVGIARFSDETKRGNGFLLDSNNNRIGKQASDILAARLTESGKFIILERQDEALIDKERDPSSQNLVIHTDKSDTQETTVVGRKGRVEADNGSYTPKADFLIIGSISEYGRTTNSDVGIFSRNKIQKANVTVNIRLVNTNTKQVVYSEEASGEATSEASRTLGVGKTSGYDASLDDAALSAAISKLVSNVMENLMDSPWQAYLLGGSEGTYFMSGGEKQGIKKGDEFVVMTKGKKVKNPQTGFMIELPGKKVAEVTVIGFSGKNENAVSLVSITSGSISGKDFSKLVIREKE
ncbi:CsgG/HfaB family protein [Parashewanella tropica]|uniref:CsgG/HfaB family protein n=1 Tax=Parashewanella tropica TaxID=2547970 RepID=UPI001059E159|nr:CsgG/HfaB family protein [Parashewanella tropica]